MLETSLLHFHPHCDIPQRSRIRDLCTCPQRNFFVCCHPCFIHCYLRWGTVHLFETNEKRPRRHNWKRRRCCPGAAARRNGWRKSIDSLKPHCVHPSSPLTRLSGEVGEFFHISNAERQRHRYLYDTVSILLTQRKNETTKERVN